MMMMWMWMKVLVLLELLASALLVVDALSRDDFPPHFLFGASTSAYQVLLSDLFLISMYVNWCYLYLFFSFSYIYIYIYCECYYLLYWSFHPIANFVLNYVFGSWDDVEG